MEPREALWSWNCTRLGMSDNFQDLLRRLSDNPTAYPFISIYLDTQADDRGRDHFAPWIRKQLAERGRTLDPHSKAGQNFQADCQRIEAWLGEKLDASSNSAAIFACDAAEGFFEAIQLAAPIDGNELHILDQPHLYPLARLMDQYPRYAAVIGNTNSARIVVFGLNRLESETDVQNTKTNRSMVGGWSQARYQRRIDNFHKQHAREVIAALDRIVQQEGLRQFVLAGDQEVVIPILKAEMPKHLTELMVDTLRLDPADTDGVLLGRSMDALRAHDTRRDEDIVEYFKGEYRAGGLAVAGVIETLTALENGQVDELLIAADSSAIETPEEALALASEASIEGATEKAGLIANLMVLKAEQTSARIIFVENSDLLREVGGCGALLRFRMDKTMPKKGNYNHDYYKVRGKEPGNQDVMPDKNRQEVNNTAIKQGRSRKPKVEKSVSRKTG
jgi:peptide chain release factor subunit 1